MSLEIEYAEIDSFIDDGHTDHCAKRLVWGDGACECGQVPGDNCPDCGEFVRDGHLHGCI